MKPLTFTVPGDAVPSRRRFTRAGISYETPETKAYRSDVRAAAIEAIKALPHGEQVCYPLAGAIRLDWVAVRCCPKSLGKRKTSLAVEGHILPTTRPDLDNIDKVVKDALTGVVWVDDAQVAIEHISKQYGTRPKLIVSVCEIGEVA